MSWINKILIECIFIMVGLHRVSIKVGVRVIFQKILALGRLRNLSWVAQI